MKHLVKFFVVTLFLFTCTAVKSEEKIVYLDMKKILNESSAGKQGQEFLRNSLKKSDEKFSKSIEKLRFRPTTNIELGISKFIDWYKKYFRVKKV